MPMLGSRSYKRYALGMMTAVYTLNLVDRGLINLLLQPVKEDLQLSDTQLGMLTGIAFALFYAIAGVPIARWADRGNRVGITALAIGLWGVTVMASVMVTSYVQLLFARVAAAVGEAGCKPPTYSLVGDYFPEATERTRAMSIYWMGGPLATIISFVVGGWLNELYGWRMTFLLMGIPGLVLAALVALTVREPRSSSSRPVVSDTSAPPMRAVFALLWEQRSLRNICAALILLYTMGSGLAPWYAAVMIRSHGMGTAELGLWLGLIFGLGGIVGVILGGYVANRWFAGNETGQLKTSAVVVACFAPCFIAFVMAPNKHLAFVALTPLYAAFNFFMGPTYAVMQRLVPDAMRATMMAVVMLLVNLIGMGIGPQIVGILSDLLNPTFGEDALRFAMMIMSLVAVWSGWHFWQVTRSIREDLLAAQLPEAAQNSQSGSADVQAASRTAESRAV